MTDRKKDFLHMQVSPVDRARLEQLAEYEETTASAVVRRLIRDKVKELGLDP